MNDPVKNLDIANSAGTTGSRPEPPPVSAPGDGADVRPSRLEPLRCHPIGRTADDLSGHLSQPRNLLHVAQFLSVVGGALGFPLHLEIVTPTPDLDSLIANKLLDLVRGNVIEIDTQRQLRALDRNRYRIPRQANDPSHNSPTVDTPVRVILVRGTPELFRQTHAMLSRTPAYGDPWPSSWRISSNPTGFDEQPASLRIYASRLPRRFAGVAEAYASPRPLGYAGSVVAGQLLRLGPEPHLDCPFRHEFNVPITPVQRLVLERLLQVFAHWRCGSCPGQQGNPPGITRADYLAARALLLELPLIPGDRNLSPQAQETATRVHAKVEGGAGLVLPNESPNGERWFTRSDCALWTGQAYNTAKTHLNDLLGEGVLRTVRAKNNRDRGAQIHFRFPPDRAPPFEWFNPFDSLPDLRSG